ncbi:MAG: Tricorn protease like protein [Bacteroidetes bacterium]|nr:MAG: Tricorn protease like protein [Bacteroidota bacterium]RLD94896.1 MAG: Tricorn protease like protein [Bacteroidota bacterium]
MKRALLFLMAVLAVQLSSGQVSARLMRYADVSDTQIVFVYGGDIWLMPKDGGTAHQLTHSLGEESWPRFSPDGKEIAFSASYNGNLDLFVIPVGGGVPTRVTYNSFDDRMVEWHTDGKHVLFASKRESGRQSYSQFYLVDKAGGMPEKLSVPYGELASFSADGSSLAYITKITENYPFKRYRGGLSSDILLYDMTGKQVENLTNSHAIDGKPAWVGDQLFYLSDAGENMRLNVWQYDLEAKKGKQLTFMEDFDISSLSASNNELIFEAGGSLYLMDAISKEYKPVDVKVTSDLSLEMPRSVNVGENIRNMSASPEGKRVLFEARGEIFNVPVKEGYVLNLTHSSGAFDMLPAWSPDGKSVAYWSDRSGEYELYIQDPGMEKDPVQLTSRGLGFGYQPYWSPDSKKIAFIDETNDISIIDVESKTIVVAGNYRWNLGHGSRFGYTINWSPDSKWITFNEGMDNSHSAIFLYNMENQQKLQVTGGFYDDAGPVFSTDGKYLFFLTDRSMQPAYSDMGDGTWIYPNATQVAAMALTSEVPSLLAAKNDALKKEDEKEDNEAEVEGDKKKKGKEKDGEDKEESDEKKIDVKIEVEGLESRVELLPPKAGNLSGLAPFDGKLVFLRSPNTGSGSREASLVYYDMEEREEKSIMSGVERAKLTADGKMILVRAGGKYGVIKAEENQKVEKPIPTGDLAMELVPKEEWRQIFNDSWRRYRDFFYDPQMHGVDWEAMRVQYGALVEDARSRWDLSFIGSNMLAELSAGHTYTFGDGPDQVKRLSTGFLGIDWELTDKGYRIQRIVLPAVWDTEVRSPFDKPGAKIRVGHYIHAVNGISLDPARDPYAAFEGLAGKTISLSTSSSGNSEEAVQTVIKCLNQGEEVNLRYLEWIETNRLRVDELSEGKLGYIYMSNTSTRGTLELVRMFYGQLDKDGFIIDERFNGGGSLADRFLELLQRPVVYNLHWRHGKDHTHPVKTNTGPMGMLINGWAGSGGDGLPWAFQELKAGPIVGERTLGILVGPATGHQLIDGGGITVPGARLYDNDGHWFWEGEGVAPDVEVWDDPNILIQGRDPQVEQVVKEVMNLLETQSPEMTPAPEREDRTAGDLKKIY